MFRQCWEMFLRFNGGGCVAHTNNNASANTEQAQEVPAQAVSDKVAWLGLCILAMLFVTLSLSAVMQKGLTNDEIAHITAGYSYWKTGNFHLNTEHPPLIKLVAALPLL